MIAAAAAFGCLPTQETIVLERFFDEAGGMQLVIHSPFGSRLNRAWGLALRKRFCRKFNFELQAAATEDNIVLSLTTAHSFSPKDAWLSVTAQEAAPSDAIVPRRAWQGGRSLAQFPAFVSSLSFNSPARMRASWARSRQCLGSSARPVVIGLTRGAYRRLGGSTR
jgi:hypothetical protein